MYRSLNCGRLLPLLFFSIILSSCTSGFYGIHRATQAAREGDQGEPVEGSDAYLSVRAFLYNASRPLDCCPLMQIRPDASLSHLYVSATMRRIMPFAEGELSTVTGVAPLLLLTLDDDAPARYLQVYDGQVLIDAEPIGGRNQHGYEVELRSSALLRSNLKAVADLAEAANRLVSGGLVDVALFRVIGPPLEMAARSTEGIWNYSSTTRLTAEDVTRGGTDLYLIVPVQKSRRLSDQITAELNRNFEIRPDERGRPIALIDGEPYTTLPYILLDYRVTEYSPRFDPLLQMVDAGCEGMMEGMTGVSIDSLLAAAPGGSHRQRVATGVLAEKLKLYLRLREQLRSWQGDPRGDRLVQLLNSYGGLRRLRPTDRTPFFDTWYRSRYAWLDECAEWLLSDLGRLAPLRYAVDLASSPGSVASGTLSDSAREATLTLLYPALDLAQEYPQLQSMSWFEQVRGYIREIESSIHQRTYRRSLARLADEMDLAAEGWRERSRAMVEELRELPPTGCRPCNDSVNRVVTRFLGLVGADAQERRRIEALRTADSLIVELSGRIGELRAIAPPFPPPPVLDMFAREIEPPDDRTPTSEPPAARMIDLLSDRRTLLLEARNNLLESDGVGVTDAIRAVDRNLIDARSLLRESGGIGR